MTAYRLLTLVIVVAHFGFLAYLVAGGFLAWRWPRSIVLHVAAAVWGITVLFVPLVCPLTWAEEWSRQRAGEPAPQGGFIDRYVEGVLYPERFTLAVQVLVALVVLGSWAGLALRRRRAGQPSAATARP